jgi:hypothetical protein
VVATVVAGVAVGALLLGLDGDVLHFISGFLGKSGKIVEGNAKAIAAIGKMLAPVPLAISAYVAFKKLPLK